MKILVPSYVVKFDLTDNQHVLLALMLGIQNKIGRGAHNEEYLFHANDIRFILNTHANPWGEHPEMKPLHQVINFSTYNEFNWGLSFNKKLKEVWEDKNVREFNRLKEAWVEINDIRAITNWCFLIGRLADKNLIHEDGGLFYHSGKKPKLPSYLWKQLINTDGR